MKHVGIHHEQWGLCGIFHQWILDILVSLEIACIPPKMTMKNAENDGKVWDFEVAYYTQNTYPLDRYRRLFHFKWGLWLFCLPRWSVCKFRQRDRNQPKICLFCLGECKKDGENNGFLTFPKWLKWNVWDPTQCRQHSVHHPWPGHINITPERGMPSNSQGYSRLANISIMKGSIYFQWEESNHDHRIS